MTEANFTPERAGKEELLRRTEQLELECSQKAQELMDSQAQLIHAERMAALGNLLAGLAHEINTPLGAINNNNQVLELAFKKIADLVKTSVTNENGELPGEMNDILAIVEDSIRTNRLACDRLVRIVRNVRNFARLDEAEWRKANIHEGIESTLTLLAHELKDRIRVIKEFNTVREIDCYPNQLNQVFMNILMNAAQAIDGKGEIRIKTWEEGETVRIAISDTGHGISVETLSRIFDPGFTTKKPGIGTGLGLPICLKIVQNHHGRIEVDSMPGRGTTFLIILPFTLGPERNPNAER
jgi:signal transduction histidine kinase